MATAWGRCRVKCANYEGHHKKTVYKKDRGTIFKQVWILVAGLQDLLKNCEISKTDYLCYKCYKKYEEKINSADFVLEAEPDEQSVLSSSSAEAMGSFVDVEEEREELNITTNSLEVSPLKKCYDAKDRSSYAMRKRKQITTTFDSQIKEKLERIYDVNLPLDSDKEESSQCSNCSLWFKNIQTTLQSNITYNDKVRLLTIIPETFTKKEVLELICCTKHMLDKSRKTIKIKGVYGQPDAYIGHTVTEEAVQKALSFYLEDLMDCSRQSPNKRDVVNIMENGRKTPKTKRYLTRSIREIYRVFKEKYPTTKLGCSKFYSLRPKWVIPHPPREVCVCVYCANFDLCIIALKNFLHFNFQLEELRKRVISLTVCNLDNETCCLQECINCPGDEKITPAAFEIDDIDDDSITFAMWEGNDLIKKTVNLALFFSILSKWTLKAIVHFKLKEIQQTAIWQEKQMAKVENNHLIIHCDFAENWSLSFQNEIQGFHWTNKQISIFTAVTYLGDLTKSFAVVSDDIAHDSSYAILAFNKIEGELKKMNDCIFNKITIISDGAASHFKNRFQLYEMQNSSLPKKWLFSATGHGKGPCDGIGGVLKHCATKYNLSTEHLSSIQSASDFVKILPSYAPSIQIILLPKEELLAFRNKKVKDWENVPLVPGIQKTHMWKYSETNVDEKGVFIARSTHHSPLQAFNSASVSASSLDISPVEIKQLSAGNFVACTYDEDWWIGEVEDVSYELNEVVVNFMLPQGPSTGYHFPPMFKQNEHKCSVQIENVLKIIQIPLPIGNSARSFSITKSDNDDVELLFARRKK